MQPPRMMTLDETVRVAARLERGVRVTWNQVRYVNESTNEVSPMRYEVSVRFRRQGGDDDADVVEFVYDDLGEGDRAWFCEVEGRGEAAVMAKCPPSIATVLWDYITLEGDEAKGRHWGVPERREETLDVATDRGGYSVRDRRRVAR